MAAMTVAAFSPRPWKSSRLPEPRKDSFERETLYDPP